MKIDSSSQLHTLSSKVVQLGAPIERSAIGAPTVMRSIRPVTNNVSLLVVTPDAEGGRGEPYKPRSVGAEGALQGIGSRPIETSLNRVQSATRQERHL